MCPADATDLRNGNDEKKLWLEYLGKLKDREDRANQITGATNWVLLALLGSLFYKGLGLLPVMVSDKDFRYNTGILTVLWLTFLYLCNRPFLTSFLP
jgi:hypothetical protein